MKLKIHFRVIIENAGNIIHAIGRGGAWPNNFQRIITIGIFRPEPVTLRGIDTWSQL